jgi:enterobacterial common antigen flippase
LLAVFSRQVSELTFGSDQQTAAVALLSLAVFFRLVSDAQGALIQGMRRISDLARMSVLGAGYGTIISIPVVYFMGANGVVPALVGIAAMTLITSWWYSRKVQIRRPAMKASEVRGEAASLLRLGFAFMTSGFLMMGAAYAVRTMVLRMISFEAAGFYSSAWTVGGLYVGFILQAMGADFYPRLTAVARDNALCNRMVNEQAQISLLLAGPGVIATLTFTSIVVTLFYSAKFEGAVEILRWICLGMTLRVISWPMGFIIVAKGKSNLIVCTEVAWTVVNVGLSWVFLREFGLNGTGMAFFASYVFHALMIYPIVRWLSGFRWSAANRKSGLLFLFLIAVVFCGFYVLPAALATFIGTLATVLSSAYSIRALFTLIPMDRLPAAIQGLLTRIGVKRSIS